ncbi:MAG: hypothetical protein RRZ34_00790 [Malacoplasma sp.]
MNNNDRFKNPSMQNLNQKSTNVNSKKKNTFNKRTFIISMSSMLGAGVVGGVVVIVPIALTTNLFNNTSNKPVLVKPVLERITTIYDLQNYTANLLIAGENLATNKEEYTVYNITNANTRSKVEISSYDITINLLPNNEINLVVYDASLISTSKYEVSLTNAEPIVSNPTDNKLQPSFNIVNQPQNQIIGDSSVNSVDFSISVSAVSNGISGETLSYKWYISDDTSNWSPLENSNTSNYRYDITGLTTKKYFKCEVSYKYAPTISSTIVYVERNMQAVISISTQPTNHTIAHDADTPILTVAASVVNSNTQQLSYQWYSSDNSNNGFVHINNATSSSYKVDNATTTKKYYKCEISSENAETITSNVVYVERSQAPVVPPPPIQITPILSFIIQPSSVTVPYSNEENIATLNVAVDVANPVDGVQPSYKWYISDNGNTGWTLIANTNQSTYTHDVSSLPELVKKYFKCEVNYDRATPITSNVAYVQRGLSTGPTPDEIRAAITAWNNKDFDVKTKEFNSLMASPTNNEKIKNYMLKQNSIGYPGIAYFFAANTTPPLDNASQHYRDAQNGLLDAFKKYNIDNIAAKPIFADNGNNFMSLKGIFNPKKPPQHQVLPHTPIDNINEESRYLYHDISSLGTYVREYNFFSVETGSYDINIQSDFTLKLSNFKWQSNFIISGSAMDANHTPFYLRYNSDILMNNATLFPGLTEFVKTTLLKLEK